MCLSREKGTPKEPVRAANLIEDFGIEGDAHAGKWHRQVSLLAEESIEAFKRELAAAAGPLLRPGSFGENIITRGLNLVALPLGTRLRIGEAELEITQIGKECHEQCVIGRTAGRCIMPQEGVFARVIAGGCVKAGDAILGGAR